jgi:uncharacterized Ntn-hydrolase superfamily protein
VRLADRHFWLATLDMLFYSIPLYIGGITQSLTWREFTPDGALRYGNFLETLLDHIRTPKASGRRRRAREPRACVTSAATAAGSAGRLRPCRVVTMRVRERLHPVVRLQRVQVPPR